MLETMHADGCNEGMHHGVVGGHPGLIEEGAGGLLRRWGINGCFPNALCQRQFKSNRGWSFWAREFSSLSNQLTVLYLRRWGLGGAGKGGGGGSEAGWRCNHGLPQQQGWGLWHRHSSASAWFTVAAENKPMATLLPLCTPLKTAQQFLYDWRLVLWPIFQDLPISPPHLSYRQCTSMSTTALSVV